MRRTLFLAALLALSACAATRPAAAAMGSRLVIAYGGDARGAIGPCG